MLEGYIDIRAADVTRRAEVRTMELSVIRSVGRSTLSG